MRQCVEIQVEGLRLCGTFHQPAPCPESAQTRPAGAGKPGVLFLNSGFLPRSAQGDLQAQMADKIAAAGFPVFRFDLPGLGDSAGELPEDAVTFVRSVEKGFFAPYASALAARLTGIYGLEKIVVGGLCGGGISAMFGAAAARDRRVCGIILLEPIFQLVQIQEAPQQKKSWAPRWKHSFVLRTKAFYEELRVWILSRRLGAPLQKFYSRWKAARKSRRPAGVRPPAQRLPKEANLKLIHNFERVMAAGVPMLVVTAQDPRRNGSSFDYLEYILRNGRGRVDYRKIEGTNHSFLAGTGPQAVQELTADWLQANFSAGWQDRPQPVKTGGWKKTSDTPGQPGSRGFAAAGQKQ